MVSQKTVLTALIYFSVLVFVSIWLMTRNFPEKQCDCTRCLKEAEQNLGFETKSKRNMQDGNLITTLVSKQDHPAPTVFVSATSKSPSTVKDKLNLNKPGIEEKHTTVKATNAELTRPKHKLGVIVPFRDRFEELLEFVPHMNKYLREQSIAFHIYVVNQVDIHRFNRAALINAGFLIAVNDSCDYIAMHDVDLLPLNKNLDYGYPKDGPFHVAAPNLHPKYHYQKFIGGIMLMSNEQFKKVNGLSTQFWGWGREDDELYMRLEDAKLIIKRPRGITTGLNTFQHNHSKKRKRDYPKTRQHFNAGFKRDRKTGLSTMNHTILSRRELTIDGYLVTLLAVELTCDYNITPWCDK